MPDGDLFKAIKSGKAEVVTGNIDAITEKGIRMIGGEEIEADILVTATGLNLKLLGGTAFSMDGVGVDFVIGFITKE